MKEITKSIKGISTNLLFAALFFMTVSIGNAQANKNKKSTVPQGKITAKTAPVQKKSSSGFDLSKLQVGGNIQGDFGTQGGSSSSGFGISAFGGYKVTEDILVGARAGTFFRSNLTSFEIGVFSRYYFNNFFAGAGINYALSSYNADFGVYGSQKTTANLTYGTIEGGYRFPVSDKITIETSVNLNIPISPAGNDIWYGAKAGAVYQF